MISSLRGLAARSSRPIHYFHSHPCPVCSLRSQSLEIGSWLQLKPQKTSSLSLHDMLRWAFSYSYSSSSLFLPAHPGSSWHRLAHHGFSWLLLDPPGSSSLSWLLLASPGFSWFLQGPQAVGLEGRPPDTTRRGMGVLTTFWVALLPANHSSLKALRAKVPTKAPRAFKL